MKHYAIVLGVSEYNCAKDLPACANDAKLMTDFLRATGKYELLELPHNVTKHEAIEKIEAFLPSGETDEGTGEVLFYFSGHGCQDDEMHYILSDTKREQINSTALNNSEIDEVVRRAKPHLFVKIIDACQSGLAYIKGIDEEFLEGLSHSAKGFESCIFLSSSKKSQFSYAGSVYSHFTKAIVDAVTNSAPAIVKFIDVQNYLADVFKKDENGQTPYFSTQCDGTEIFCEKNTTLKCFLESLEQKEQETPIPESAEKVAKIQSFLNRCREEADVREIMDQVRSVMESMELRTDWIKQFYDFSFDKVSGHGISSYYEEASIAKILHSKLDSENLFVKIEYESVRTENPYGSILSPYTYRERPSGFQPVAPGLPCILSYSLRARNANLPDYDIPFIFIYSPTYFYAFTSTQQFVRKGWKEYDEERSTKYTYRKITYGDFSKEVWESALKKWLTESEEYIEKTLLEYGQE